MKKIYLYIVLVVVVGAIGFFVLKHHTTTNQPEPSSSMFLSSPSPTATIRPSLKPVTGINVQIYDKLIVTYDRRRILLAADCQSANPSNVDYHNGTTIMLDNSLSSEARVVKIGNTSYNLAANNWIFVTLSSKTLPVNLPMFCGSMELGQIGIIK